MNLADRARLRCKSFRQIGGLPDSAFDAYGQADFVRG
jgi:hypothetical protein